LSAAAISGLLIVAAIGGTPMTSTAPGDGRRGKVQTVLGLIEPAAPSAAISRAS